MPRGPLIHRTPAIGRVLRHVRRDVHPAEFPYEFLRVVGLVPSHGHSLSRRQAFGHQQRRIPLRSAVGLRQKRLQQESVAVFHQYMPHIAQLRLASSGLRPQSGIGIGARFMSLVLSLFSTKVDVSSRSRGLARSVLLPPPLMVAPRLPPPPTHRHIFLLTQHPLPLHHPLPNV